MTSAQLTLQMAVNQNCDFASFETGSNTELVAQLRNLAAGDSPAGAWLWGDTGCGRSHLLQAVCAEAAGCRRAAFYLPLAQLPRDPAIAEDLQAGVVALDDIECWLADAELEAALVGIYQRQLDSGGTLLVAASKPASRLDFALADLASRLRALSSYRVLPLDEQGLYRVLTAHARRRGLELNAATADFWLSRSRRSLPVLLSELDQLDQAALASQRRLTIPLLKEVLRF